MDTNMEDRMRIIDIVDSIREIQGYIGNATYQDFVQREDIREAITSQLLQIGGAAAVLTDEFKDKYRDIDWDVLKGLQYASYDEQLELDLHPQWYIIKKDLPILFNELMDLATEIERNESMEDDIFDIDATKIDYESEEYQNTRLGDQIEDDTKMPAGKQGEPLNDNIKYPDASMDEQRKEFIEDYDIEDDSSVNSRFEDQDLSLDEPEEENA